MNKLRNVVCIDTAGPVIGVCLQSRFGVFVREKRSERGTEALLIPWILELCEQAQISLQQVEGIAVTHGPGTFTGLRVGLATATGLALSIGCPIWSTCSLWTRFQLAPQGGAVLVMLDAKKSNVYAALYQDSACLIEPMDTGLSALEHALPDSFRAVGEGSLVYREWVESHGGVLVEQAHGSAVAALAALAQTAFEQGAGVKPESIAPLYLREPDAKPPAKK